ncbi:MAG: glutamine-hydrolyzing GMP synthase, partial [Gemmatimonadetes bacterium]|nr:glutamine-hydrolyzing GMP synthase [Gemmatimonadota bacterium]
MEPAPVQWIAILDYGSQYTQLIARRVREAHVYCEILPWNRTERLADPALVGVVLSGGPASINAPNAPALRPEVLAREVPVLGICYGMQLLAHALGGRVHAAEGAREYGPALVDVDARGPFAGLGPQLDVWMSHGDHVDVLPAGAAAIARSPGAPIAAFEDAGRRIWAMQFHPEVSHTPRGREILDRFLDLCGCRRDWEMGSLAERRIAEIRERVGDRRALCAVSAGVDSSVAAALVGRAIGERLHPVFVDHGLHRDLDDVRGVLAALERAAGVRVEWVDASARFLDRLRGVVDPEAKRKIIGEVFIRVFEEVADRLGDVDLLVQGTLYPDVIESVSF